MSLGHTPERWRVERCPRRGAERWRRLYEGDDEARAQALFRHEVRFMRAGGVRLVAGDQVEKQAWAQPAPRTKGQTP